VVTVTGREPDPSRADPLARNSVESPEPPEPGHWLAERLAETQRLAEVGGWAWDIATGIVTWSDEMYRIFGLAPEAFTPSYEAVILRIDPNFRGRSDVGLQAMSVDGRPRVYEFLIVRADGAKRWVRAMCVTDADAAGLAVGMHGTAQDVTDFGTVDVTTLSAEAAVDLRDR
jgi:PAS domain-containing protein